MLKKYNKMNDITKILIAMLLGSLLGILLGEKATCIGFIGTIWLNLMKMFLVPIVICMMVKGITSMDNPKTLGRIGIRIVVFYMFTTVAASVLGLVITGVFHPGVGFQFTEGSAEAVEIAELPTVGKFFTDMFSSNIFATFNNANMMQVLIIAVIMGVAIVMLPEEKRTPVRNWFVSMAGLGMSILGCYGNVHHQYCPEAGSHRSILSYGQCPGKIRHQPAAHHVQAFRYLLFVLHPSSDSGILFDFMAVYRHYPSEFLEKELSDHSSRRQYLQQCCSDSGQHECGQRKF